MSKSEFRKESRNDSYEESHEDKIKRMHAQYELLCKEIPNPKCALNFSNPFELLVATVLSAQTTDKRVNSVTPELFATFPGAYALANAPISRVENIIRPLGFYKVKAQHLVTLSAQIVEKFNGNVPSDMKNLISLSGVGRKTANVVLGNAFHIPGFPVDTHVIRVTGRLRWRSNWNDDKSKVSPELIEREITSCFDKKDWTDLSHRLILHGRNVCKAVNPKCDSCPLRFTCPYVNM